jgi:Lrp/AsnC family leucine-responsive transcriptional regulator
MDRLDHQIIARLSQDARVPITQIAKDLGVAAATTHQRVRKLESRGVIQGYRADLDWEQLGFPVVAVVSLSLEAGSSLKASAARLQDIAHVQAAFAVTGEFDILAIVRARSSDHLGDVLEEIREVVPGRSRTVVVLSTFFSGAIPPLVTETED